STTTTRSAPTSPSDFRPAEGTGQIERGETRPDDGTGCAVVTEEAVADKTYSATAVGFQLLAAWAAAAARLTGDGQPAWPSATGSNRSCVRTVPLRSPVAESVGHLIGDGLKSTVTCPRCPRRGY